MLPQLSFSNHANTEAAITLVNDLDVDGGTNGTSITINR